MFLFSFSISVIYFTSEKGKLSFEDIKRIIDRSVNKTHEFINNMIEKELIEEVTPYLYTKKQNNKKILKEINNSK